MPEELLTVNEAAARLEIAPYTVREWLKRGTLRGVKVSRYWRVPESALSAVIVSPTAAKGAADANE